MQYLSTRDSALRVSAQEAIVRGLAPQSGLFVPETFPQADLDAWKNLSYPELAEKVLAGFLTDYSADFLHTATASTYGAAFGGKEGETVKVRDGLYSLELWHGPTCAFKDYALQLMPKLLVEAKKMLGRTETTRILVATSGDTGKAALAGYADLDGIEIERLLYHVSGSSEKVAGWMQELSATGKYTVDAETLAKIQQSFAAGYADDADGAAEIKARFDGDHYLCDTHTAVAFRVAETRRTDAPMVVLSTASPFKFPRDVLTALGGEAPASDFAAMAALTAETGAEAPASLRELDKLEVRFKTVLQPADIRTAALR